MSTAEATDVVLAEEDEIKKIRALRRFDTEVSAGDGRTVLLRIAPFGETALSADGLGGSPKGVPYREELMPGLYDNQARAANRIKIWLNFEHQEGLQGVVGKGVEMWQQSDGYHAAFRMYEDPAGEKALMLVHDGMLGGASVESFWLKSLGLGTPNVRRVRAHLDAVALCREGAYASAGVTGIRSQDFYETPAIDPSLLPVSTDRGLLERAERLGIRLPDDMLARHS